MACALGILAYHVGSSAGCHWLGFVLGARAIGARVLMGKIGGHQIGLGLVGALGAPVLALWFVLSHHVTICLTDLLPPMDNIPFAFIAMISHIK